MEEGVHNNIAGGVWEGYKRRCRSGGVYAGRLWRIRTVCRVSLVGCHAGRGLENGWPSVR
jgi:hypothetical protein